MMFLLFILMFFTGSFILILYVMHYILHKNINELFDLQNEEYNNKFELYIQKFYHFIFNKQNETLILGVSLIILSFLILII